MRIVLFEPEIPPNTGNVARLCAAFATELHLIEPLGFRLENRYLKRAGLDYWPHVSLRVWPAWQNFAANVSGRMIMATTKASQALQHFRFESADNLIFGPETRGLPDCILAESPWHLRIPSLRMDAGGVRSLNLSTACGIVLYAALADTGLLERFS